VAGALGVAVTDVYALLKRLGRDVAGAVVISDEAPPSHPGDVVAYTPETLEEDVLSLPDRPLGIHDDSELSLAGLQDKLLLVEVDGGWARPTHGRPSTHILKVEDRRFPGLISVEASCLRLARAIGLTTISVVEQDIGNIPCLIVSRFDRTEAADGLLERIHQEDTCQALARDPDAQRGLGRYERAGGPRLAEIAALLDRYASSPIDELDRLVAVAAFNGIIGNADAHGRNISVLHPEPGDITLAPLYDTVPTLLWPSLRKESAMSINGISALPNITRHDVVAEAASWHHDPSRANRVSTETAERLLLAVDEQPMRYLIADIVRRCVLLFLRDYPLGLSTVRDTG
jgi:serine/threonine-protein kinase HipA